MSYYHQSLFATLERLMHQALKGGAHPCHVSRARVPTRTGARTAAVHPGSIDRVVVHLGGTAALERAKVKLLQPSDLNELGLGKAYLRRLPRTCQPAHVHTLYLRKHSCTHALSATSGTQRLIGQTDDYTDFELTLRPTADFIAHLLSRGRWLRVVQPRELADEVRRQHLEAAE
jgi:hypothetical protein